MYSLLIVDDEMQARTGLKELFDWEAMNITVVADAEDGVEALRLLSALKPDILLTDVRMNRMGGIELAQKAREILPDLAIVFLSGYADADYLQSALRISAADYLYKPVRPMELQKTMTSIVERLGHKQAQQRQWLINQKLLDKSRPVMIERFLQSWFSGTLEDDADILEHMSVLGLTFPGDCGIVAVAFQPDWVDMPGGTLLESCQLVLEQNIRKSFAHVLTCVENGGINAILGIQNAEEFPELLQTLERIADEMKKENRAVLLTGVSAYHKKLSDAQEAIREAQETLSRMVTLSGCSVFSYEEQNIQSVQQANVAMPFEIIDRYLFTGNIDALWSEMQHLLTRSGEDRADPSRATKMMVSAAVYTELLMSRQGIPVPDAMDIIRPAAENLSGVLLARRLHTFLETACQAELQKENEQKYSNVVGEVLDIIRNNFRDKLSIDEIAARVHYSPSHLCSVFHQETGTTIGDVLLKVRIQHASHLLCNTDESASSIANQSGYSDVQYFTRVFKRFIGITPMEYRRRTRT